MAGIKNMDMAKVLVLKDEVAYQPGQVVSKTLAQNEHLSVTLFAFDKGEEISTHESGGDAFVTCLDGVGKITIDGVDYELHEGESIVMPAKHPHAVFGKEQFKMLLVASPVKLQECAIGDIMCLSMPIHSHELVSTLQTMMFDVMRPRKKPIRPQPKRRSEKEQKVIDDAKALLRERNNLSEEEAHKYIQKLSMDSGNNLVETAEMILAFD